MPRRASRDLKTKPPRFGVVVSTDMSKTLWDMSSTSLPGQPHYKAAQIQIISWCMLDQCRRRRDEISWRVPIHLQQYQLCLRSYVAPCGAPCGRLCKTDLLGQGLSGHRVPRTLPDILERIDRGLRLFGTDWHHHLLPIPRIWRHHDRDLLAKSYRVWNGNEVPSSPRRHLDD